MGFCVVIKPFLQTFPLMKALDAEGMKALGEEGMKALDAEGITFFTRGHFWRLEKFCTD